MGDLDSGSYSMSSAGEPLPSNSTVAGITGGSLLSDGLNAGDGLIGGGKRKKYRKKSKRKSKRKKSKRKKSKRKSKRKKSRKRR